MSWRPIAIMEDIAALKAAQFLTPTTGFTREQITDLVGDLARPHGPLCGDRGIFGLKTPADYLDTTRVFVDIKKRCEVGMGAPKR